MNPARVGGRAVFKSLSFIGLRNPPPPGRSLGGVELSRSGESEGEGSAWETRLLGRPSPEKLAERSFLDPSRGAGGVHKALWISNLKAARPLCGRGSQSLV